MALGPGKYDAIATDVRARTQASGVVVIVVDGVEGSGMSAQMTPALTLALPAMLRRVADQIDASFRKD